MKNKLLLFTCLLLILVACKKEENRVTLTGGTAPVLSANRTGTIAMSFATQTQEAVKLSWTNPNYQFSTGLSSQNVTYQLEVDSAGKNFSSPGKKIVTYSNDLEVSISQADLNDWLINQLGYAVGVPVKVEMRLKSSLPNNNMPLYSNTLSFTTTPFLIPPKVTPPTSGKLYITGSATPGNWMGTGDPELLSQKFIQRSATLYELPSVAITGGQSFLFVPVYGNWSDKYGYTGSGNANNPDGDDFVRGGNDLKAPPASGNYKVVVDFQRGKYTFTKL